MGLFFEHANEQHDASTRVIDRGPWIVCACRLCEGDLRGTHHRVSDESLEWRNQARVSRGLTAVMPRLVVPPICVTFEAAVKQAFRLGLGFRQTDRSEQALHRQALDKYRQNDYAESESDEEIAVGKVVRQ